MKPYAPRKYKPLRLIAKALRGLVRLINLWPVLLIIAFFLPVSPHIRWEYRYGVNGMQRYITDCTYLGVRGFINHKVGDDCPIIALARVR